MDAASDEDARRLALDELDKDVHAASIGPARQSAGYPVEDVHGLDVSDEPLVARGPIGSKAMLVVGVLGRDRYPEVRYAARGKRRRAGTRR